MQLVLTFIIFSYRSLQKMNNIFWIRYAISKLSTKFARIKNIITTAVFYL